MSFQELFETYVLASAEHQEHAQEVVGGRSFAADLDEGVVTFGELTARAELIGTEASGPGSWMWAWANPGGYGDHVTRAARHARDTGAAPELTTPELPLDGSAVGYRCAVVTCGLAGGYARGLGARSDERGVTLDGREQGDVRVDLDAQGRVGSIEGHLNARRPPR